LSDGGQEKVKKLAPLLRLADALDREHRQTVHSVQARVKDSKLELELTGEGDLLLERWALQQKASMFENVYDLEVEAKE